MSARTTSIGEKDKQACLHPALQQIAPASHPQPTLSSQPPLSHPYCVFRPEESKLRNHPRLARPFVWLPREEERPLIMIHSDQAELWLPLEGIELRSMDPGIDYLVLHKCVSQRKKHIESIRNIPN